MYVASLVSYDIITSTKMFYEYQGLMGHKAQVLEMLITEVQEALKRCNIAKTEIMNDLKQMKCKVLTENDNLVTEEDMTSEFTNRINAEFEAVEFGVQVMRAGSQPTSFQQNTYGSLLQRTTKSSRSVTALQSR